MFGISATPELFQKILEQILIKCEGPFNYIDDIILFAQTKEILKKRLENVLETLQSYNIILNKNKCIYEATELEFLGLVLSPSGIKPSPEKVKAIQKFRAPNSMEELRGFWL
jgi:hypothetical protein